MVFWLNVVYRYITLLLLLHTNTEESLLCYIRKKHNLCWTLSIDLKCLFFFFLLSLKNNSYVTVLRYQRQWLSPLYFCASDTKLSIILVFYCALVALFVWCSRTERTTQEMVIILLGMFYTNSVQVWFQSVSSTYLYLTEQR